MNEIGKIVEVSIWRKIKAFLNISLYENDDESLKLTIGLLLMIVVIFIITSIILKIIERIITNKLPIENKGKFVSVFSFTKWFIYIIVLLIVFSSVGVNVTAIFAASAALLVGVGLALETLFQDIISGIFILIDKTVHVGDIIEIDDKVGRVTEINLRTTKAVTIDNRVLIIPNHKYLTSSLFNWTQNGVETRESVEVGVAYGSNVELVKEILLKVANSHPLVIKEPEPSVIFTNFGDSSLDFKLVFTLDDSFQAAIPKSDMRFEIDKLFKQNNITIPFPQRDIHIFQHKNDK